MKYVYALLTQSTDVNLRKVCTLQIESACYPIFENKKSARGVVRQVHDNISLDSTCRVVCTTTTLYMLPQQTTKSQYSLGTFYKPILP